MRIETAFVSKAKAIDAYTKWSAARIWTSNCSRTLNKFLRYLKQVIENMYTQSKHK